MVVKVRGMKAARIVQRIMEEETGQETPIIRDTEEDGAIYMVANTWLEPYGEQKVLDYVPRGSLVYCRTAVRGEPLSPSAGRLSPHTLASLREQAALYKEESEKPARPLPALLNPNVQPRPKKAWLKDKKGEQRRWSAWGELTV